MPTAIIHERVRISKSKSKKKPFKVVFVAKNGEPLDTAQLLTTVINCKKNIRAIIDGCGGKRIVVLDTTKSVTRRYWLSEDGHEEELDVK